MQLTEIIRRPLVTEKTSILREDGRTIVFHVAKAANKVQIKEAVEKGFNVKVTGVNVMNMKGKPKRVRGNRIKHSPAWKKAVVQLHPDDSIELFEGQEIGE